MRSRQRKGASSLVHEGRGDAQCVPGSGRVRDSFGKAGGTPAPRHPAAGRGARRMQIDQTDRTRKTARRTGRPARSAGCLQYFQVRGHSGPCARLRKDRNRAAVNPYTSSVSRKTHIFPKSVENRAGDPQYRKEHQGREAGAHRRIEENAHSQSYVPASLRHRVHTDPALMFMSSAVCLADMPPAPSSAAGHLFFRKRSSFLFLTVNTRG